MTDTDNSDDNDYKGTSNRWYKKRTVKKKTHLKVEIERNSFKLETRPHK